MPAGEVELFAVRHNIAGLRPLISVPEIFVCVLAVLLFLFVGVLFQRIALLAALLRQSPAFADRNARFFQLCQKPRSHYIIRHGNVSPAKQFFIHARDFRVRENSDGLDPTGKKYLAFNALCLSDLPRHRSGVPGMPACRILRSLCVVSTRIFAHRDFAFYRNKVVSRIRAAKLVVDNKVRRVHIWVICCLKAPLPLAFIKFELPVLHKVRALNRHFPRTKLARVLVFPLNTRSHRWV